MAGIKRDQVSGARSGTADRVVVVARIDLDTIVASLSSIQGAAYVGTDVVADDDVIVRADFNAFDVHRDDVPRCCGQTSDRGA